MHESAPRSTATLERGAMRRALFATSSFRGADMPQHCGDDCYSYYFVFRAFAPLLARWGAVHEVANDKFLLDDALIRARSEYAETAHLSFLPPHYLHVSSSGPNAAFPFWEFPDIPREAGAGDPRSNWVDVCQRLSLMMTACEFTRQAFVRAGVSTPIRVVPVPIRSECFQTPAWQPEQRAWLDVPCYVLPPASDRLVELPKRDWRERARCVYRNRVRPHLPPALHRWLAAGSRAVVPPESPSTGERFPLPYRETPGVELSGIVYASIFNPFDMRKNWQELLSAFLKALGDKEDATLVLKLAVSKTMANEGLHNLFCHYRRLRIKHRAKVVAISSYLSDEEMLQLTQASTYYVNSSLAEGACLPLQDFLASGRPAVAPAHTAMSEYIDEQLAFVVDSRPEPTHWPWDADKRPTTTWNRVRRGSLEEQFRASYDVARRDGPRYRAMSISGRERMNSLASVESVWPKLQEALSLL